jgi:hypothetical protein
MELTLFLSARNIVSHIVTSDLKIFRQYCYTLFFIYFFLIMMHAVKYKLPLLHSVVWPYTIFPFATHDRLPAISFTITAELIFKDILC